MADDKGNKMRVLVCGDRNWTDSVEIHTVLHRFGINDTLVHGACRGADTLAAKVGATLEMTIEPYPADWSQYGKAAGPIRNQQMLDSGIDLVIAFHPDLANSKGTANMLNKAGYAGIPIEIYNGKG